MEQGTSITNARRKTQKNTMDIFVRTKKRKENIKKNNFLIFDFSKKKLKIILNMIKTNLKFIYFQII